MTSIRPFQADDREAVLALAPRLTEGVASWRDGAAVAAAVRGWIDSSIASAARPGHAMFVAVTGERVVGVVTVGERSHFTGQVDGYVGELAVAADVLRQRIATQLMAAAEQWASERGLTFITLDTGAANTAARQFYAARGYAEEDLRLTKRLPSGA